MTDTAKLIDRIRKLLALASNNSNIHEASLAAERAQKLIIENNLSLFDIEKESPKFSSFTYESKIDPWRRFLAHMVAECMGGHCFYERAKKGSSQGYYIFSGPNESPESIAYLYSFICDQLEALYILHSILNKSDMHGKSVRTSWFNGAVSEITVRLRKRQKIIETESDNKEALVLSKKELDKYTDKFDLVKDNASSPIRDDSAYNQGRKASEKVEFGDPKIRHGMRQLNP